MFDGNLDEVTNYLLAKKKSTIEMYIQQKKQSHESNLKSI